MTIRIPTSNNQRLFLKSRKDNFNVVIFEPITTYALRPEIQLQEDFSAGITEWKVK